MKRLTAVLICVAMLMTAIPLPTLASEGFVEYTRSVPVYPVMNAQTYTRSSFLSQYVGSDNNSIYNIAPAFRKQSESGGASSMPDYLTFGTSFTHKNDSNTYAMYYEYDFEAAMAPALKKGDLHVCFAANLTNDRHWNAQRHLSNKTAYPVTWLRTYQDTELIEHTTKDYGRDGTWTMGKNQFVPIPARSYQERLWFRAFAQVCTCGSSKVSNISIMLADVAGPAVKSIYTSGERGGVVLERLTEFKAGDTVRIHLKFDEPIRLGTDVAMPLETAPKLKLQLKRVADNMIETGFSAEASLISLVGDTLTFEYVVPADIAIEHYVDSIQPYSNQSSWITSTDTFDVKLFGKKSGSQATYINYSYKTTSLVVDLAGNPVNIGCSVLTLERPLLLDSIPPRVTKVDASLGYAPSPTGDLSRRDVFAGIGDSINITADFSEPIYAFRLSDNTPIELTSSNIDSYNLKAELNLTTDGQPLIVQAKEVRALWDGKKSVDNVHFWMPQVIAEDTAPLIYNDHDLPIGINRIYLDKAGYLLTDALGNPYDDTRELINTSLGARLMPDRQLWLDVTSPSITTSIVGGEPFRYEIEDLSAFYIPLQIADKVGHGEEYMSLTNGCTGRFGWIPGFGSSLNYSFEYAITGSAAKPSDSAYKQGSMGNYLPFPQLDGGNYIHIRLLDGAEFSDIGSNLYIFAYDNANNQAFEYFPIEFNLDRVAPRIIQGNVTKKYEGGVGRLQTNILIEDHSTNLNIQYQWSDLDAEPGGVWSTVPRDGYDTIGDGLKYHAFKLEQIVEVGTSFTGTLHIRVADERSNMGSASFNHEYNLILPTPDIEFATNPSVPHEKHTIKLLPPTRGKYEGAAHDSIILVRAVTNNGYPLYWFKQHSWFSTSSSGLTSNQPIDLFNPSSLSGWNLVDWAEMPMEGGETTHMFFDWGPDMYFISYHTVFLPNQLRQYGKVEVTILSRDYASYMNNPPLIDASAQLYSRLQFDLYYASDDLLGPNDKIHDITITPLAPVSYQGYSVPGEVLPSLPAELSMPQSLDGTAFRVTIEPLLFNKTYGLTDIDFTSADTRLALYKIGDEVPIYTAPLVAKSTQDIAIPAGVAMESGSYKVVVTVKAKASGRLDSCEYANINIDRRPLDTYGVSNVTTVHSLNGQPLNLATDYSVAPGSRTTEIYLSSADVSSQTICFTSDLSALSYGAVSHYAAYIKAWNATASDLDPTSPLYIPESSYNWLYFPEEQEFYTSMLSDASRDDIAATLGNPTASTAAVLPLLPGENLIKYEIALANGHTTGVQTLTVVAGDAQPTIEMGLNTHNGAGFTSSDVTTFILSLNSTVVAPKGLTLGLLGATHEQVESLNTERSLTLVENGAYTFYTYDKYHNIGSHTVAIDYIDKNPPAVSVVNKTLPSSSTFNLEVTVTDNLDVDSSRLFLMYDNEYLSLLALTPDLIIDLPQNAAWQATQASPNGLFATTCTATDGAKTFTIQGAFRHDPLKATTVDRTLTLYGLDGAGNKSVEHSVTISAANRPAEYTDGVLADGGFSATFNQPVLLKTPVEGSPRPAYSLHKHHLPFHSNGVYPLAYTDLFGDDHESTVEVDHYTTLYEHTVSISESAPTNQNVQVLVNVAFNPSLTLELPGSIPGAIIETGYDGVGNPVGATITMTQNGTISFGLKPKDTAFPTLERKVAINNIDKIPANVALNWIYTAPIEAGETPGEVIVSLDSDEDILPLLGTGTTHTFRLDDQVPYTFHYSDVAGNCGSIVATLPVTITEKELQPLDTTPPQYTFAVYSTNTKISGYTQEGYEALIDKSAAFPLFSGVLQLRFTIDDENQTWLSVKDISSSTPINAVHVSGTTVTVTDNAEFTVVIEDALGNDTEVPIVISSADNTPPTGTIFYEETGPYTVRAYLTLSDDQPGTVSLKTTEGVKLETYGPYAGKYYHDFLDNGSFTFRFVDAAGNNGSVLAAVTSLDMSSPIGTINEWSPYYVDEEGNAHKAHLASLPTNSDVSVYIRFDKPIRAITPSIENDNGSMADIAVSHTADTAVAVFKKNAEVRLRFDALNGKTGQMLLLVDIIDKLAPEIMSTRSSATAKLVTYSFLANEPVVLEDGENKGIAATSVLRTFYLNGDYALKFTDLAGNSTVVTVTITDIDRIPPDISIEGLPATLEAIEAHNLAHGTALLHKLTRGPLSIGVSLNEAGAILFRGKTYQVSALQQIGLSISANGAYELVATDLAGNSNQYQFRVDCLDQTPPKIVFTSDVLALRQGISSLEYEQKVLEQTIVTDNFDPSPTITISEWSRLTEEELCTPGTYRTELEASDQAGNVSWAQLYVRITDPSLPEIRINGTFALPNETIFVAGNGSREITVTIDNLPSGPGGSEPYTMYWKSGLNTPGQMKNALAFDSSFTAPRDGFLTVYIVTQSKASFTVYIYLQS